MPVRAAVMTEPEAPIELWDLDDPVLEAGSILLETVASEVCGTDVHLHHGRLAGSSRRLVDRLEFVSLQPEFAPVPLQPADYTALRAIQKFENAVDIPSRKP